jgi:hypothetical protein
VLRYGLPGEKLSSRLLVLMVGKGIDIHALCEPVWFNVVPSSIYLFLLLSESLGEPVMGQGARETVSKVMSELYCNRLLLGKDVT